MSDLDFTRADRFKATAADLHAALIKRWSEIERLREHVAWAEIIVQEVKSRPGLPEAIISAPAHWDEEGQRRYQEAIARLAKEPSDGERHLARLERDLTQARADLATEEARHAELQDRWRSTRRLADRLEAFAKQQREAA